MSLLLSLCAQIIRWYQNVSFEVIVNKTIMVVPFFHQHDSIISLKKSGIKSEALELNSEHSHFIIMEQNTDLKELENFRLRVEERLLMPIGRGKRYRKVQMFDPTLSEFIDESFTVIMKWNLMSRVLPFFLLYLFSNVIFNYYFFYSSIDAGSIPENLPTISSTCTPMVGLLIQGGPIDIDHVVDLLRRQVPVLVVQGSGQAADLLAFVYFEKVNQLVWKAILWCILSLNKHCGIVLWFML